MESNKSVLIITTDLHKSSRSSITHMIKDFKPLDTWTGQLGDALPWRLLIILVSGEVVGEEDTYFAGVV
jgi:hypothetical protein